MATPDPPTLEEIHDWPATVPVSWGCAALGISRSHGYELIRSGEFPARTLRLRSVRRVVTASLVALLEGDHKEVA